MKKKQKRTKEHKERRYPRGVATELSQKHGMPIFTVSYMLEKSETIRAWKMRKEADEIMRREGLL
ncbi:MAG: hypothetical protein LBG17_00235 [Bacteroidales bacterium]|nr:hypothetical protein [Bacteroidales bacterium]